jgi:7,8-dihydropterin-6-yl-methyl-4-(beta-D-ribofuranosyl)aminobenzene 5'-phosphate synthase
MHAARRVTRLSDPGAVAHLPILPIFDWYTARADLAGGAGVAYLLRADATTVLFDLGLNQSGEHPSPVLCNMAALGVDLADLDAVFISHLHGDHTGGSLRAMRRPPVPELALSGEPVDFRGIPAYVPGPAACPTARVVVLDGPERIAPGIAAMGPDQSLGRAGKHRLPARAAPGAGCRIAPR